MIARLAFPSRLTSRRGFRLLVLTLILLCIGIVAVYNASSVDAFNTFGNKYHFALQQLKWALIGLFLMVISINLPLAALRRLSFPIFLFSLLLMIIVIIPGVGTKVLGARRWINLSGFTLQPSELLKLTLMLYLSSWLQNPKTLPQFLTILLPVLGLTMLQPDLGTAIIISSSSFLLFYLSGTPLKHLFTLIGIVSVLGLLLILISPYRKDRLTTFLDPTSDPLGRSYHINQVLIALGSGGLTGVGLGRSRQKYEYLPEAPSDSIFAIIAEETGFLGGLFLIGLFVYFLRSCFNIALNAKDHFHQLLAAGISSWLLTQFLLNLGAMTALVPLTGIPLPLISYGGSALITTLAAIGLLINITRHET